VCGVTVDSLSVAACSHQASEVRPTAQMGVFQVVRQKPGGDVDIWAAAASLEVEGTERGIAEADTQHMEDPFDVALDNVLVVKDFLQQAARSGRARKTKQTPQAATGSATEGNCSGDSSDSDWDRAAQQDYKRCAEVAAQARAVKGQKRQASTAGGSAEEFVQPSVESGRRGLEWDEAGILWLVDSSGGRRRVARQTVIRPQTPHASISLYCSLHQCARVRKMLQFPSRAAVEQWVADGLLLPRGADGKAAHLAMWDSRQARLSKVNGTWRI
jgi:hypothetical protein